MKLKTLWQKIPFCGNKLTPEGQTLIHKCMPCLLVLVFASATVLTAFGVQFAADAKSQLEIEKQALADTQKQLEKTLTESRELLDRITAANSNTQILLDEATVKASDKIEQLQEACEILEDKERQRWILPIQYTMCTSKFGYREQPAEGASTFHYGVDLAAPTGTPVVAARSGTVSAATYGNVEGYYVNIDHLDGYDSRYLHMSSHIVKEGQFVLAGQIIGYCGSTGVSTGPHLHFGIYKDNEAVNPADYIEIY